MTKNIHQKRDLLTAADHFDLLHSSAHGTVLVWEKLATSKRWIKLRPETDAANALILGAQKRGLDRYITVNEFHGWRCVRDLKSLRSCFVDIDGVYDLEWVISAVSSAGLPSPTIVVFSGRGTHLYWQIDAVPRSALPVWQRVQDEIVRRMSEAPEALHVDLVVRDCTRVLRLVGSVNSKNLQEVRGLVLLDWHWDIETLAYEVFGDEVAPKASPLVLTQRTYEENLALDAERESAAVRSYAAAKARKGTSTRTKYGSIYQWWALVYRDLVRIGDANFLGIPEGHRDSWLFLYATSLCWFAEPESLASEITAVAKSYTQGLKIAEVRAIIAPTLARVEASRAGEKVEWAGTERDPRLHFKRETLLARMAPIIPDGLYPQLRAIIPNELRQERRQERFEARYEDHNTGTGVRVSNQQKRATARILKAQGMKVRDIAAELGVALGTVHNWTA
jgi:hypothetical protein